MTDVLIKIIGFILGAVIIVFVVFMAIGVVAKVAIALWLGIKIMLFCGLIALILWGISKFIKILF